MALGYGFLGAVLMLVGLALWSWWSDVHKDVTWAAFWRPVRDVSVHGKPWLEVHLIAHLLGGIALALFLLGPWFTPAWTGELWQRAAWVFVWQVLWERIQHENWKNGRGSSDYPWWSFVWDILITYLGWFLVELLRWSLGG